jgi:glycosyltransferase involved in cell wall biosynthesis
MTQLISIVTPVFNRAEAVIESINSSLRFLQEIGQPGEIIVVDDASSDGSFAAISNAFADQIADKIVRLISLRVNLGPTGAKQVGAEHAKGQWLIFMDSDDSFIVDSSGAACLALEAVPVGCPVVFFRCIDKVHGQLIGPSLKSLLWLDLQEFLNRGTPGECLPAVRRDYLMAVPYFAELRGFESLTYAKLIQRFGPACVVPVILRSYCTNENGGRLSTRRAIRLRGCLIAKGYLHMVILFGFKLRGQLLSMIMRIFYHGLNCLLFGTFRKIGHKK